MKEYKVIKGFFKLSEQKTYNVGDTIKLNEIEAESKAKEGLIEFDKVKEQKVKKPKND